MNETDLILQWSVAALVAVVLRVRGQLTLFHPTTVYLAFHVVMFCLRPTLIAYPGSDAMWDYLHLVPEPGTTRLALLLSSAGLGIFVAAYSLFSARAAPLRQDQPAEMDKSDLRALIITAALFVPPGLLSIFIGDASTMTILGTRIATGSHGYILDVQLVLVPISILIILATRWRWWSLLPFIACTAIRAADHGWAGWTVGLSCFLLLLVWLWDHQRQAPSFRLVVSGAAAVALALFLAQNWTALSSWVSSDEVRSSRARKMSVLQQFDGPNFAGFDFLTHVLDAVPDRTRTFTFGTQHLSDFTGALPDWIWKPKPVGPPVQRAAMAEIEKLQSLPRSIVGDGWLSGGWAGMFVTLASIGGGLGVAFTIFARHQTVPHLACAYLIILAACPALFRDGNAMTFRELAFALPPLFVWKFIGARLRRARAAEEERERLHDERHRRRLLGHALLNPDAATLDPEAYRVPEDQSSEDRDDPWDEPDRTPDIETVDAPPDAPTPPPDESLPPAPGSRPTPRWHTNDPKRP